MVTVPILVTGGCVEPSVKRAAIIKICPEALLHKWLCAPKGAGFLYVRPERQQKIEPLVVRHGWSSAKYRGSTSRYINMLAWTGTTDPAAYLSVPTAIVFMMEHDWSQVRAACHRLGADVRQRIHAHLGTMPIYPDATT